MINSENRSNQRIWDRISRSDVLGLYNSKANESLMIFLQMRRALEFLQKYQKHQENLATLQDTAGFC